MEGFTLSPDEEQELRAAHRSAKASKNVKAAYKINAIILLGTGWSLNDVSEALLLDQDTLSNYVKKYRKSGLNSLLKVFYSGGFKKLSSEQITILCEELDTNMHLNTKSICMFIKNQFDVTYTIGGMTDLLHCLGYTYKKPKLVPAKPDLESQEIFLEQYIEWMKNKKPDEAVFFIDAVHPVHNSMPAYGWIKKGEEIELKSNSGRSRLNIHGAMNAETYETTIVAGEANVDKSSTIELFTALEKSYPLALVIHVILDNARYHYSKEVMEYVKNSRINLVFLPPYSPELNLIERLWKVFKKNVLYNKYYSTYEEFRQGCMNFFLKQKFHSDEISSIMGDGLEALA